ncbi:MAG: efflux transporter outer membrane subunit [Myxococcota bacterium]|nr:efflux transporter outer membrane subunit [Myxococcota bacterium]
MRAARFFVATVLVFAVGCAIGPNYERPEIEVPENFRGAPPAEPVDDESTVDEKEAQQFADLPWWEIFDDPVLVSLIEVALQNNLNLEMAVARTEQAYRQSRATMSGFFPQATYGGTAGATQGIYPEANNNDVQYSGYAGTLNVAWEIDVWGRIRRANQSAKAQLLGAQDYQRGVLLSIVADVASMYFLLLELDASLEISEEAVAAFAKTKRLFKRKFEGGAASRLQLTRAAAAEAQAASWVPEVQIRIAAVENRLATLLGRTPEDIPRGKRLVEQVLPDVPVGLPSSLLERRPDIQQAEQRVVSANAEVGVSMGNFLPRIGLVAMYGGASYDISSLGSSGSSSLWNIAGEMSGPIFKAGMLYSEYKARKAMWEEAKAAYELAALTAFSEVSSKLVRRELLVKQRMARHRRVKELRDSVRLSLARYEQGLASYFEVLEAQQDLFPAEFDLADTRLSELMVVVNLYRALGGGWELGLDWLPKKEEGETEGDSSSEGGSSSAASPAEGSGADQPSEPAAPDPGKKTEAGSTP